MEPVILIVDDDAVIRTMISRVLSRCGYQVREAEDGRGALDAIAVERPALVLTDQMMPRMQGDELIAQVRQEPNPLPCILMSAYHDALQQDVPFLPKPFAVATLLDLVAGTLASGARRSVC